ncbi:MAG: IS4 family transposase, partial [Pirellulales bacterium]|nr:IS4 family transposase [Pirellulales bacterium]
MRLSTPGSFRQQVRFLQRQFLQDGGLPFTDVLSVELVSQALAAANVVWNERIYSPLVTLWVFLGQVLSQDHSCRAAVARLIAHRVSLGESACSAETGAYCQARKRLPEKFFSAVARQVGRCLDEQSQPEWLWHGRRVYAYDGSTVTMPDTVENQAAYPQIPGQKPGLGFPIARLGAIFSLSCGALIDLGICRYAGKGQSEATLLRTMWSFFRTGDILLGDRLLCAWTELVVLKERGVDCVCRFTSHRKADFRKGKRLGKGDHLVIWPKPTRRCIDRETHAKLPEFLLVRECRVFIEQPGFRSRTLVLATTLLDANQHPKEELVDLYRARWNAELDLRSLKCTLQMDILRCQTPELVRKEIWTHVLAYNLIRTIMAQAAAEHDLQPRTISFKGAVQTLEAFQPVIAMQGQSSSATRKGFYERLLQCIASHRVADRPDRIEPRLRKRRFRRYEYLNKPRRAAK